MSTFTFHTIDTAPAESKPLLEDSVQNFGMIPNLHAAMAESPVVLEAYKLLHDFFQKTSFDKDELTVVWQTINIEHECHYCVPAHTMIANMMQVDPAITDALRNRGPLPNEKLQALHNMTLSMTRNRGNLKESELKAFYAAGYTQRHVLEITLGLSQKVMSNYVNHFSQTPIDDAFVEFAWEGAKTA